jgi:dienelactone hydrolase
LALVAFGLSSGAAAHAEAAQVRSYGLGRVLLPDPGPKGPLPTRMAGVIGAPAGPGPHPVVLVLHGRHGTGCPIDRFDTPTWPCFRREQPNALGLRHVVSRLARRGFVSLAPDLNAAFTDGWGEPDDRRRWPRLVGRTLAELGEEAGSGGGRFGLPLQGRVDLDRLGLLGHSLSGLRAVRAARRRGVRALFLLAPVASRLDVPDVPLAVAVGTCDGDTGDAGEVYFERARRNAGRRSAAFLVTIERANHNFYNRTLSRLASDDAAGQPGCRPRRRPTPGEQQRWIAGAAADFFASTMRAARRPAWLRVGARAPRRTYGLSVVVRRTARRAPAPPP